MKRSFPPIIHPSARVLILGSLPGEESLRQRQYYAHPRNQFWRILSEIYRVPFLAVYPDRLALLQQKHLALWDVVQRGEREGSLDQAIRDATPNDFSWLFTMYPDLRAIVQRAEGARHVFAPGAEAANGG
jgi:hypoxanthine-DNA glycosylase